MAETDQRTLGRLEEAIAHLKNTTTIIAASQLRSESKLDDYARQHREALERHAEEDAATFHSVRDAINEIRDRLQHIEPVADMVESNAGDIEDLKRRIAKREAEDESHRLMIIAIHRANAKWRRGLISAAGIAGTAAGATGLAPLTKAFKWVISLVRP